MQGRRSGCNKRAGYHEQSKLRPMTADQVGKGMQEVYALFALPGFS